MRMGQQLMMLVNFLYEMAVTATSWTKMKKNRGLDLWELTMVQFDILTICNIAENKRSYNSTCLGM